MWSLIPKEKNNPEKQIRFLFLTLHEQTTLSVTCALVALLTPQLTLGLTLNKIKKTLEWPVLHVEHSLSILNIVCVVGTKMEFSSFFFFDLPIVLTSSTLKVNNLFLVCLMGASENNQYPFIHVRKTTNPKPCPCFLPNFFIFIS